MVLLGCVSLDQCLTIILIPKPATSTFLSTSRRAGGDRFADFFGLQDELTRIFGRKIDLVVAESVKNPYFKSSVLRGAEDVYAA